MTPSQHKAFKKKLFPKKAKNCAECSTRIGVSGSKRRHITAVRKLRTTQGDFVSFDAFQLCEQCAENFLADKWHLLPNVCKDVQHSDLLAFGGHVGGMQ